MENSDFQIIVDSLKARIGKSSDRQFALAIGMRPDSYANAKKRGVFPFDNVIQYCISEGISLDSLFFPLYRNKFIFSVNQPLKDTYIYPLINFLDDLTNIVLPIENTKNYYVFIHSKSLFRVDINIHELSHNSVFLFKSGLDYVLKLVVNNFNGTYSLIEDSMPDIILNSDNMDSFEVIGKVIDNYEYKV